jgi:putative NADH-flavin reductase
VNLAGSGPEPDGAAGHRGAEPDLLPCNPEVPRRGDHPVQFHGPALPAAADGLRGRDGRLQAADTTVEWFYVSPPFGFGAHKPGTRTGAFRLGTDVIITDADRNADISGADFAIAFADEIERPDHHHARFTLGS